MCPPSCAYCGKSLLSSPMYRTNPKGQKAIWACKACMEQFKKPIHPLVDLLTKIIHKGPKA